MKKKSHRIGCATGFQGGIDALVFDCLADVTLPLLIRMNAKDLELKVATVLGNDQIVRAQAARNEGSRDMFSG